MHKILNNFFDKKEIETIINFVDYLININEGVVYSATGRKLIGLDNLDKTIVVGGIWFASVVALSLLLK